MRIDNATDVGAGVGDRAPDRRTNHSPYRRNLGTIDHATGVFGPGEGGDPSTYRPRDLPNEDGKIAAARRYAPSIVSPGTTTTGATDPEANGARRMQIDTSSSAIPNDGWNETASPEE